MEAETEELGEIDDEGEREPLGDVEAEALDDGEREAEALELGETLEEGLSDLEALALGETDADGETEELGESEELGEVEALGDREGEALKPKSTDTRLESSLIGFHIAVKRILPAVRVAVPTVAIISCETNLSEMPDSASTEASGELSTQISPASKAVPVVWARSPAVVIAVPISRVPEPVKSTSTVA
jgi:hypothetical protein